MLILWFVALMAGCGAEYRYNNEFPAPKIRCGYNEMPVKCRTICPPQSCEIAYTEYACGKPKCERGCDCLPNHLRNASGICIPNDQCPPPPTIPICDEDQNEILSSCKVVCPPQTCESIYTLYSCVADIPCEWGCNCLPGYLRNSSGNCIPTEKCPTTLQCDVAPECRPTCAVPNPPGCEYAPSDTNQDGCNCQRGYILSDVGGQCIPVEQCPTNITCNGDPNAVVRQCPQPCPSTCDSPDDAMLCKRKCEDLGCDCKPGYLRSEPGGKCIKPEDCKGGNPCGLNGTFASCKINCPSSYCPADDSRAVVICDPPPPQYCSSGCICRLNHRRLSTEDQRCIRADECPPVNCTRPHERWNPCPMECTSGYCSEVDRPPVICNTFVLNCNPQCTCEDTYFRDPNTGICVSSEECREINEEQECEDCL